MMKNATMIDFSEHPLIETDWLAEHLTDSNLRIVDMRWQGHDPTIQVPTSVFGLKRSADQISSMDIWVTGLQSLSGKIFQSRSRFISVGTFELCFGYESQSRPPGFTISIAMGVFFSTSVLLRTN